MQQSDVAGFIYDKCSDVSKWLTHFFGLAFLPTDKSKNVLSNL